MCYFPEAKINILWPWLPEVRKIPHPSPAHSHTPSEFFLGAFLVYDKGILMLVHTHSRSLCIFRIRSGFHQLLQLKKVMICCLTFSMVYSASSKLFRRLSSRRHLSQLEQFILDDVLANWVNWIALKCNVFAQLCIQTFTRSQSILCFCSPLARDQRPGEKYEPVLQVGVRHFEPFAQDKKIGRFQVQYFSVCLHSLFELLPFLGGRRGGCWFWVTTHSNRCSSVRAGVAFGNSVQ